MQGRNKFATHHSYSVIYYCSKYKFYIKSWVVENILMKMFVQRAKRGMEKTMNNLIYIADDEKNIRELISGFLKNDGFEVMAFETGDSLLAQFIQRPSDMVILDIMMEGTDGLMICADIRRQHNVPIIIVSARDSELDRITGFTLGGDDYLVKPFSPIELVARVKALFRRVLLDRAPTADNILKYGDITLNVAMRECLLGERVLEVTPTEFALLTYLFENSDRAVSREELLKKVWKFDFDVDSRATDDVLKRLRKKISGSRVRIESVWGFGFKLALTPREEAISEGANYENSKNENY